MEPDFDMLGQIWGDWDGVEGDTRDANQHDADAEQRAADFVQGVAAADVASIENDTTRMGWKGKLNRGQFGTAAAQIYNWTSPMEIRDAARCTDEDARRNTIAYQALCKIQQGRPELYATVLARIAWDRGTERENRGPFGNDWGE